MGGVARVAPCRRCARDGARPPRARSRYLKQRTPNSYILSRNRTPRCPSVQLCTLVSEQLGPVASDGRAQGVSTGWSLSSSGREEVGARSSPGGWNSGFRRVGSGANDQLGGCDEAVRSLELAELLLDLRPRR